MPQLWVEAVAGDLPVATHGAGGHLRGLPVDELLDGVGEGHDVGRRVAGQLGACPSGLVTTNALDESGEALGLTGVVEGLADGVGAS